MILDKINPQLNEKVDELLNLQENKEQPSFQFDDNLHDFNEEEQYIELERWVITKIAELIKESKEIDNLEYSTYVSPKEKLNSLIPYSPRSQLFADQYFEMVTSN